MPNGKSYWFPAKRYGWGWGPPATWQGWVVLLLWFAERSSATSVQDAIHPVMIVILTLVCYVEGRANELAVG